MLVVWLILHFQQRGFSICLSWIIPIHHWICCFSPELHLKSIGPLPYDFISFLKGGWPLSLMSLFKADLLERCDGWALYFVCFSTGATAHDTTFSISFWVRGVKRHFRPTDAFSNLLLNIEPRGPFPELVLDDDYFGRFETLIVSREHDGAALLFCRLPFPPLRLRRLGLSLFGQHLDLLLIYLLDHSSVFQVNFMLQLVQR